MAKEARLNKKTDWHHQLSTPRDLDALFELFKERAEALTVKVIRCQTKKEAEQKIIEELKDSGITNAVSVPLNKLDIDSLQEAANKEGIELRTDLTRELVERSELGITEFQLAIADLGTLAADSTDVYDRLVSSLPPTHLAVVSTSSLVESFEDSLELIETVYGKEVPRFLAFVTGPSKTADIERVLTIGVHGPGRLITVFVDEEEGGDAKDAN